jgi:hypothetical protein
MAATIPQAQTLLRSINYSIGEAFTSKLPPVVACSWLYIYPVLSGEMNYAITGLSMGMAAVDIYPPGLILGALDTALHHARKPAGNAPLGEAYPHRAETSTEEGRTSSWRI